MKGYVRIGELDYSLDSAGSIAFAYEALDAAVRTSQCGKAFLTANPQPGDMRKSAPSLAAIEARLTALEKAHAQTALATMKASLRQSVAERAPSLRPDVSRILAKANEAVAKLDAVLAKCAAQDGPKHTPVALR